MKLVRRYASFVAGALIAALATTNVVWAQTYPARSVRVIVPFAPGGAVDIIGRPILQELSKPPGWNVKTHRWRVSSLFVG